MQNLDVGDEQIGVMIELKCRGWIEMLVVSSRKDVAPVWMFNHCLSWVRYGGVPRSPEESTRRTLRTLILASTAASVMTLLQSGKIVTL